MNSTAICVLGMHRSGTSTLMRAINLLGVYVGEESDLIPADTDNPEGYWERIDINRFHEALFAVLKSTWDTVAPLPEDWHLSAEVQPYRVRLRELILRDFADKVLWGWKDPRTCLTFPLWRDVLSELGIRLVVVFAFRNPLDTAKSLLKRDNFPMDKGLGIWFNYNLHALQELRGVSFRLVFYDRLLEDWKGELKRCSASLSIPWPDDEYGLTVALNGFIKPTLRHSKSNPSDLSVAPRPVQDMFSIIEKSCGEVVAFEGVDRLRLEFWAYARFFQQHMLEHWERLEQIKELQADRTSSSMLEGSLKQLAEREKDINALKNSLSWKITAPIRKLLDRVR